jgi:hypothetical protein
VSRMMKVGVLDANVSCPNLPELTKGSCWRVILPCASCFHRKASSLGVSWAWLWLVEGAVLVAGDVMIFVHC